MADPSVKRRRTAEGYSVDQVREGQGYSDPYYPADLGDEYAPQSRSEIQGAEATRRNCRAEVDEFLGRWERVIGRSAVRDFEALPLVQQLECMRRCSMHRAREPRSLLLSTIRRVKEDAETDRDACVLTLTPCDSPDPKKGRFGMRWQSSEYMVLSEVLPDTPAERSGARSALGMRLVTLNGVAVRNLKDTTALTEGPGPHEFRFLSDKRTPCRFWERSGSCREGGDCRFKHVISDGRDVESGRSRRYSRDDGGSSGGLSRDDGVSPPSVQPTKVPYEPGARSDALRAAERRLADLQRQVQAAQDEVRRLSEEMKSAAAQQRNDREKERERGWKWGSCQQCGANAQIRCGACKAAFYCGKTCQRAHWPSHKLQCGSVDQW